MTRNEFINDITTWDDLIEFCIENDCEVRDDIYSEDERDEYIDDMMEAVIGQYTWRGLMKALSAIPVGDGYYLREGIFDWREANSSDFADYKERVLEWGDDCFIWEDSEETVDNKTEEADGEALNFVESEDDMSISELFLACRAELNSIAVTNSKVNRQS